MKIICDKKSDQVVDSLEIENKASGVCAVDWTMAMLDRVRLETCGKCVMCRDGIVQLLKIVTDAAEGRGQSDDQPMLADLAGVIKDTASCEMARTAAAALVYSLENHAEEWDLHIRRRRCPELVCKEYISVHIMPETCTGCGDCLPVCPEAAITGATDMIHVINQETCTRCGLCIASCKFDAIQKAGPIKPKTPDEPVPVGSWEAGGGRRRRRG